jgi:hypothetical protein
LLAVQKVMIDLIWNFHIVSGAARLGSEADNEKKNSKVKSEGIDPIRELSHGLLIILQ